MAPESPRREAARAAHAAVSPELVLVDPELAERELARLNAASLYEDLLKEVNALVDRALEQTSVLPGLESNQQR